MGFFDGFAEGLASAVDDIRHKVVEEPMYGREVTGNIELPQQVEAPAIEPPQAQTMNGEVFPPEPPSFTPAGMGSAQLMQDIDLTPQHEPPVEPTSWQEAVRGIEPPQLEAPQPDRGMER